jgi:hypothetical protein
VLVGIQRLLPEVRRPRVPLPIFELFRQDIRPIPERLRAWGLKRDVMKGFILAGSCLFYLGRNANIRTC